MAFSTTTLRRSFPLQLWSVPVAIGFSLAIFLAAPLPACAEAKVHHPSHRHVTDPYDHALEMRNQLEGLPPAQRTRERYEPVLDAFRAIYHNNPTGAKAPAAVAAVADLLAEKGRVLSDAGALKAAIGQYEFLRKQYPNSPQVANALLLEGDICQQDLKDNACAKGKFTQVVAESPGTSFAEQAAMELRELQPVQKTRGASAKASRNGASKGSDTRSAANSRPPVPVPEAAASNVPAPLPVQQSQPVALPANSRAPQKSSAPFTPQKVVAITGMRHWSNPTSTRIAIDLGGQVQYEAARVPNPDRIFFDLHGARLAPNLNGRQVEVIDDGYLRRIRAAQFGPDVTRVVLDVTNVSQYSAFLLPNPWRLIIDIHSDKSGRNPANTGIATMSQAPSSRGGSAESTIAEVAKLSSEPAKVPATAGPTSGPVSVRVPGTTLAPDRPASDDENRAPVNPTISARPNATPVPALSPNDSSASSSKSNSVPGDQTASSAGSSKSKKRNKGKTGGSDQDIASALPHAADPDSDGQRSLVRALGLKVGRIVIDAGHGGHDSGTLGPGGIQEKDVVLDVALRVGKLLHQRLGAEIVYTRSDDTFIPLETRTAIANKAQADLFLSIHANSSPEPEARGVEAYYLNFTSDPDALDVAARENAVSTQSVHQLSDLVRKIALKDKIDESREFAADVDAGLYSGLRSGNPGLKDRGVKKAPFVVLIGAQMPSVLAEISFLTNPDDAEQLRQGSYRQRIAESLDAGVERYLRGLSGTRPTEKAARGASNSAEDGGQ
jgi:N-acetylmuramoyl-L-alanine amidase